VANMTLSNSSSRASRSPLMFRDEDFIDMLPTHGPQMRTVICDSKIAAVLGNYGDTFGELRDGAGILRFVTRCGSWDEDGFVKNLRLSWRHHATGGSMSRGEGIKRLLQVARTWSKDGV
jgi:hypothetical protein